MMSGYLMLLALICAENCPGRAIDTIAVGSEVSFILMFLPLLFRTSALSGIYELLVDSVVPLAVVDLFFAGVVTLALLCFVRVARQRRIKRIGLTKFLIFTATNNSVALVHVPDFYSRARNYQFFVSFLFLVTPFNDGLCIASFFPGSDEPPD